MSLSIRNQRLIIILAAAFILAVTSDIISESDIKYSLEAKSFERKLYKIEEQSVECLKALSEADTLFSSPVFYEKMQDEHICSFFRYTDDGLAAWTGSS